METVLTAALLPHHLRKCTAPPPPSPRAPPPPPPTPTALFQFNQIFIRGRGVGRRGKRSDSESGWVTEVVEGSHLCFTGSLSASVGLSANQGFE